MAGQRVRASPVSPCVLNYARLTADMRTDTHAQRGRATSRSDGPLRRRQLRQAYTEHPRTRYARRVWMRVRVRVLLLMREDRMRVRTIHTPTPRARKLQRRIDIKAPLTFLRDRIIRVRRAHEGRGTSRARWGVFHHAFSVSVAVAVVRTGARGMWMSVCDVDTDCPSR